mgnify:CR=1 FL=1
MPTTSGSQHVIKTWKFDPPISYTLQKQIFFYSIPTTNLHAQAWLLQSYNTGLAISCIYIKTVFLHKDQVHNVKLHSKLKLSWMQAVPIWTTTLSPFSLRSKRPLSTTLKVLPLLHRSLYLRSAHVEDVRCLSNNIIWYLGQFLGLIGHFVLLHELMSLYLFVFHTHTPWDEASS